MWLRALVYERSIFLFSTATHQEASYGRIPLPIHWSQSTTLPMLGSRPAESLSFLCMKGHRRMPQNIDSMGWLERAHKTLRGNGRRLRIETGGQICGCRKCRKIYACSKCGSCLFSAQLMPRLQAKTNENTEKLIPCISQLFQNTSFRPLSSCPAYRADDLKLPLWALILLIAHGMSWPAVWSQSTKCQYGKAISIHDIKRS